MTGKILDERWLDDAQFIPLRRLEADGAKPGAQIPFGIGAHKCLGQTIAMLELRIFFALLLRKYSYKIESDQTPRVAKANDGMPTTFSRGHQVSSADSDRIGT